MKDKNIYWVIGGLLNAFTAVLHTIDGQKTLIDPLLDSALELTIKIQLLGVWHMVTIMLFVSSYALLRHGLSPKANGQGALIRQIGYLYVLFAAAFILASIWGTSFAPQWILLLPIGGLALLGCQKQVYEMASC